MPASRTASRKPSSSKSAPKASSKAAKKPASKATTKSAAKAPPKDAPKTRMSLEEVMAFLEKSGTEQTRKTWTRHGATGPMFGVLFGTLFGLVKKIGVDHDLAMRLWSTGNVDAKNLAYKIADPARLTPADLDRWVRETPLRMCGMYVSMLAEESGKGLEIARRWITSSDVKLRIAGWGVVSQLAGRDASTPDSWFSDRLGEIEKDIQSEQNEVRGAMNMALITIGGRSPASKKAALAAAKRIGKVEVDHGDTACKTPEASPYIEKMWERAKAMRFESPTEHESSRQTPRLRC